MYEYSYLQACCQNNYVVKSSDKDLEILRKDMALNKKRQSKLKAELEVNESEEENNSRYFKNQVLEKHMKENSFKLNNSMFQGDITDKCFKLSQLAKISSILQLKVINSATNLTKGLIININAQGIEGSLSRNAKDGLTYFGYYPDEYKKVCYYIYNKGFIQCRF